MSAKIDEKKIDEKKIEEISKAMAKLGLGEIMIERLLRSGLMCCDEACVYGCAACCASGTANRAAFAA